MTRYLLPFLAIGLLSLACRDDEIFGGDDDDTGGEPGDDDTTEAADCEEFSFYRLWGDSWSWGEDNTIHNADASFVGECIGDLLGHSVKDAGDLNGDGIDDLAMISDYHPEVDGRGGKLYIVFGGDEGWATETPASGLPSFIGSPSGDSADVEHVRPIGDVDGDGFADLAVEGGPEGFFLVHGNATQWPVSQPIEEVASVVAHEEGPDPVDGLRAVAGPADVTIDPDRSAGSGQRRDRDPSIRGRQRADHLQVVDAVELGGQSPHAVGLGGQGDGSAVQGRPDQGQLVAHHRQVDPGGLQGGEGPHQRDARFRRRCQLHVQAIDQHRGGRPGRLQRRRIQRVQGHDGHVLAQHGRRQKRYQ